MIPYLRAANVKDGRLDLDDIKEMDFTPAEQVTFALNPGDVLVTEGAGSLAAVGASAVWSGEVEGTICFQNTLLRLRPSPGNDPRFLMWWARHAYGSGLFAGAATGANIYHLGAETLRTLPAAAPPLSEQRAIADYLDAETARIDDLEEGHRGLVKLLEERLNAETRRLVAIDDDGRPYPVLPIRRRWDVVDCKHRTPEYLESGYPIVSPGDATPGMLDLARCSRFVGEADFVDLTEGPRKPRRGDIIYTRNASIGIASLVDTDQPFSMGQDVCLIRSRSQDQRYLTYVLNSVGLNQLEELKIGSTFTRINVARVRELSVPCPSVSRQQCIAMELDRLHEATMRALTAATAQIDLLMERRQALITAAVTGQFDIPGVPA